MFETVSEELHRGVILERPQLGKQASGVWVCRLASRRCRAGAQAVAGRRAGAGGQVGRQRCGHAGAGAPPVAHPPLRCPAAARLLPRGPPPPCLRLPLHTLYTFPPCASHPFPHHLQYLGSSGVVEYVPPGEGGDAAALLLAGGEAAIPGMPGPGKARLPFSPQDVAQGSGSLRVGDHVCFRVLTNLQVGGVGGWAPTKQCRCSVWRCVCCCGTQPTRVAGAPASSHPSFPTLYSPTPLLRQAVKAAAQATVPGAAAYAGRRAVEVTFVRYAGTVVQVRLRGGARGVVGCDGTSSS